jgi:tetratricopeptide (TPR) repeat protein
VQVWGQRYERTPGPLSLFEIQDDVASRVAATVGDSAGLLVRAMATSFKDRPLEGLSVTELVLRYFAYTVQLNPVEHGRLRDVFERALAREPDHALGWACLALLLENEYTFGFNLRDRARELGLKAAQRAMDLDASCQAAWRAMAAFHFFDRDLAGLRLAADRTIAINPISPATGHVGLLLALAGEWDRGIPLLRRAIDLNPNHSGWFHLVVALDHYRRGEFADALAQAKLSSVPQLVTMPLIIAAAAGQLGRVVDVRAAFETLRQQHADFLAHERARQVIRFWVWEADLVDALMEGFSKAQGIEG